MSAKFDGRVLFIITLIGAVGAAAVAMGVTTPADRLKKAEAAAEEGQKKDVEQDGRLDRLEGLGDRLEDIAEAVNAGPPRRRRRGRRAP